MSKKFRASAALTGDAVQNFRATLRVSRKLASSVSTLSMYNSSQFFSRATFMLATENKLSGRKGLVEKLSGRNELEEKLSGRDWLVEKMSGRDRLVEKLSGRDRLVGN